MKVIEAFRNLSCLELSALEPVAGDPAKLVWFGPIAAAGQGVGTAGAWIISGADSKISVTDMAE